MKLLKHDHQYIIGKYYLLYSISKTAFKQISIFKYDGIFSKPLKTDLLDTTDIKLESTYYKFELTADETYTHVTMEEIALNL